MTRSWQVVVMIGVAHAAIARADGPPPTETPDRLVLRLVNQYRQLAGAPPVRLDAALSKDCMAHAEYMRLNKDTDAMVGLNAHTERPELPGASPAGAACGKSADLFPGVADLGLAVDGWMAGIYHRRPMLSPQLAKIGVGYAALPDGTLMAALMLVDRDGAGTAAGWPIAYPANAQTDVPLEYANEIPNPVPDGAKGGYAITLEFPPFDKLTGVRATLTDAANHAVPMYLSDPEHPATSFGQYGVISVIPQQPLRADATYNVRITATWNGKASTWSWSFSTLGLRRVAATDEAGLLAALGVPSLVRGTVMYAAMMDTSTVFLQLAASKGGRYEMVSAIIPIAVWKRIAGRDTPKMFVGKLIDVQATPVIYQRKYLNLTIAVESQLRVVER